MVLSLSPDKVVLPQLTVNKDNINTITESVISLMQKYLMTSSIELSPQIISLNSPHILKPNNHHLGVVAGFLIKEDIKYFDSFWLSFNYESNTEYSPLILEVIQKLR
jgi:hypothetical protein